MNRRKHIILILALVLLIGAFLWADDTVLLTTEDVHTWEIGEYRFEVDGKTKAMVLRQLVIPSDGDPLFDSEEKMIGALNAKRQTLINQRLFTDVSYSYELIAYNNGVATYAVTFYIVDSKTLLIVPYPKFSNDKIGLTMGVKAFEKNILGMMGTLTLTASTSQNDGGVTGWDKRRDILELGITGLPVGSASANFTVGYDKVKSEDPSLTLKTSFSNIKLFGPSLGFGVNYAHVAGSSKTDFDFTAGLTKIKILGVTMSLGAYGEFTPLKDFSKWNPVKWGITSSYGPFNQNGGRYTLATKVEFNKYSQTKEKFQNLLISNTLTQHGLHFFKYPISFNMGLDINKPTEAMVVSSATLTTKLGTSFTLPFGIRASVATQPRFEYSKAIDFEDGKVLPIAFLTTGSLSSGSINWDGNFRRGHTFSFSYERKDYIQKNNEKDYWFFETSLSYFPFAAYHMNPSLQVVGFATNGEVKRKFLPSATKEMGDYFRGFLTASSALAEVNKKDLAWGFIGAVNFTTDFINFGFAKSYASPYVEVGVFADETDEKGYQLVSTIGLDGWIIFNKHTSYPIRGSLGFNLEDVTKAFADEISWKDVEWELFIGFDLHF